MSAKDENQNFGGQSAYDDVRTSLVNGKGGKEFGKVYACLLESSQKFSFKGQPGFLAVEAAGAALISVHVAFMCLCVRLHLVAVYNGCQRGAVVMLV